MDITRTIRHSDMTPFQVTAVGICLLINMIDGFDVLAISFVAPEIARQWALPPAELGILFSIGLAGMVIGALFIGPLADRIGRRRQILACLVVISAGMLASAAAQNLVQLAAVRLITGLGVGGILASINTMTAEYSSDKRRKLAISLLQAGYPVGGILAGLISAFLLASHGWRSVFVFGGVLTAAMIPLVYLRLPESLEFLVSRRGPGALDAVNRLLARLGHSPVSELPQPERGPAARRSGIGELFSAEFLFATLSIWLCFVVAMSAWYFAISWTPKVLVDAGLSVNEGISGGLLLSLGAVVGGIALGFLSSRFSIHRLVAVFMLLGAAGLALFGQLATHLGIMLVVAFGIGWFLAGCMVGLYAIVPEIYPARVRSTGTGWALGIGRLGAVMGPYVAGLMIAAGWDRSVYYPMLGLPLLIATFVVLRLGRYSETR